MHAAQLAVRGLEGPEDIHLDIDPAAGPPCDLVRIDEDGVLADGLDRAGFDPILIPRLAPVRAPPHEAIVATERAGVQELVVGVHLDVGVEESHDRFVVASVIGLEATPRQLDVSLLDM